MPRIVTRGDLGDLGEVFARGGTARLFKVKPEFVPWTSEHILYKEYKPSTLRGRATALHHSLASLVGVRDGFAIALQEFLDRYGAWPLAVVAFDGVATGLLIPDAGARYLTPQKKARTIDGYLRGTTGPGYPTMSLEARNKFAGRFLRYFAFLHVECDVVYGDLSGNNVLVGLKGNDSGNPFPFIVDMDSARKATQRPAIPQGNTSYWETPERRAALARAKAAHAEDDARRVRSEMARADNATKAGDVYKAALLVARLYAPQSNDRVRLAKDPEALRILANGHAPAAARSVEAALAPTPGDRPTMLELTEAFIGKLPGWGTQ